VVLDLILSDDRNARGRAIAVLVGVTQDMHGFRNGVGWPTREHEVAWRRFWESLGNIDKDSPRADRQRAINLWRQWLHAGRPIQKP
jgi:hypothetical protein